MPELRISGCYLRGSTCGMNDNPTKSNRSFDQSDKEDNTRIDARIAGTFLLVLSVYVLMAY